MYANINEATKDSYIEIIIYYNNDSDLTVADMKRLCSKNNCNYITYQDYRDCFKVLIKGAEQNATNIMNNLHKYNIDCSMEVLSSEDVEDNWNIYESFDNKEADFKLTSDEELDAAKELADEIKNSYSAEEAQDMLDTYDFTQGSNSANSLIKNALLDKIDGNDTAKDAELEEDFESTKPAQPLPHDDVYNFIRDVAPGKFFHVGYMKEMDSKIPSKYKGGRGSMNRETGEFYPRVRILKCTEFYGSTGTNYENKGATVAMRAATGRERVGNKYEYNMSDMPNKIGVTASGNELLQFYPRSTSKPLVKYFISIDDSDLHEATKEEVAQYLTPTFARELLNGVEDNSDPTGAGIVRMNLNNIYYIGNLGHSIF